MFFDRHKVRQHYYNAHGISGDSKERKVGNLTMLVIRNNGIDEGVMAFGLWLNSEDRNSLALPISMREFMRDQLVVLHDRNLGKKVSVDIIEGVPSCRECDSSDCAHVGFAICLEQMNNRS